jgi:(E)-4-hydroxy-3-methylbut-2-enyl-diphosphate synthase
VTNPNLIKRRRSRAVRVGRVWIGGGHPISIQSMAKITAKRTDECIAHIRRLEGVGCEIIRLAVEDAQDVAALRRIKKGVKIPLVADIHFDYRLALGAIEAGIDKVRLNPGNIFKPNEVRDVIAAAQSAHIPIRVGANSGSLRVKSRDTASSLVKSVKDYLKIIEKARFRDIVISLKGSDLFDTIRAYKEMAVSCEYPLHVGVTATGLPLDGMVKSAFGIGHLLFQGIGDTIRVSLLDDPAQEVAVGRSLLSGLGLRRFGPEFVCCPTCGRCQVDLLAKARRLEGRIHALSQPERARLKKTRIAVMGCVVNGPGEAREADLGIAFSKHKGVLFKKGKVIGTVRLKDGEDALLKELQK